jgi:hypothetical protein
MEVDVLTILAPALDDHLNFHSTLFATKFLAFFWGR